MRFWPLLVVVTWLECRFPGRCPPAKMPPCSSPQVLRWRGSSRKLGRRRAASVSTRRGLRKSTSPRWSSVAQGDAVARDHAHTPPAPVQQASWDDFQAAARVTCVPGRQITRRRLFAYSPRCDLAPEERATRTLASSRRSTMYHSGPHAGVDAISSPRAHMRPGGFAPEVRSARRGGKRTASIRLFHRDQIASAD